MKIDIDGLRIEWHLMLDKWKVDEDMSNKILNDLIVSYSGEGRHYHTLEHISSMLLMVSRFKQYIHCELTVFLATWFHDAIQGIDIDSEGESAKLAIRTLGDMNLPSSIIHNVYQLIIATRKHDEVRAQDGNIFIDIDMSILGVKRETYKAYMSSCRKEYKVSDELYNKGRSNFLKNLLNKENIFLTELFRDKYEQQAIDNINYEISKYE
jgi:predicted metal-dependent HD superfamily phosphohydrolase